VQCQLRGLRYRGLHEDARALRIDADRQVVEHHLAHVTGDLRDRFLLRLRRERVQVSDDEEALVLVLQPYAIPDAAQPVTEVQPPRRPLAGRAPSAAGSVRGSSRM